MVCVLVDMDVHQASLEKLKTMPEVSVVSITPSDEPRELPADLIGDIDFDFCTCPPTNLDVMKRLKVVQIASAGYTQLFGLDLPKRDIQACNAAGVNDIPIAQWNIAMMINLLRDIRGMIRNQEAGIWDRPARFQSDLRGLTVGIWGYGGIGRETARLAKAVGMKAHVLDVKVGPRPTMYVVEGTGDPEGVLPNKVFSPDQQKDFLSGLDFLVLSMPLTNKTRGIIGKEQLSMLPPRAYVLNPARGPLIEEQALLDALRQGTIAGAALDTHYYYPMPADHPLWRFPNVLMTPHISGSTGSPNFLPLLWDIVIQNVQRFQAGRPLLNELNASQLAGD
jgi:phosphoglycerate dehydrogenase-like enzyme